MERKLFTWTGWDEIETAHLQFYDAELIVDVAQYKAGTKFPVVCVNFQAGTMSLYDERGVENGIPTTVVKLELVVKP